MKPRNAIFTFFRSALAICFLVLPTQLLIAQPDFSGFLQLDKRFIAGGDSVYIDGFYNRFRLEMNAPVGSQLYLFSSLDLRFYDFPDPRSLSDLEDSESVFPHELTLWEAFGDVYGFLFEDLDIRVGRQRIAWGRADRLNPTDNLNPNDFSDLVHFTEMAPSWAVKGTWYAGSGRLTGVWLPGLTPVLLPRNGAGLFLGEAGAYEDEFRLPDRTPRNSMFAFRWDGSVGKWDYSVSYFNGFDDLPVATRLVVNPPLPPRVELEFPRMQVLGADMVTEFSGIVFWAEAGLFWPEETALISEVNGLSTREMQLEGKPYLRFTLGGDYTFSNGLYLNSQWMHGFDTERGAGNLNDYFVVQLEKAFFEDDLLLAIGNTLEVDNWKRLGYGLLPEMTYQGIDNFEAGTGAFLVWGEEGTLLHSWKSQDQVFLRFRFDF